MVALFTIVNKKQTHVLIDRFIDEQNGSVHMMECDSIFMKDEILSSAITRMKLKEMMLKGDELGTKGQVSHDVTLSV
jgi:proline dehydrogenase